MTTRTPPSLLCAALLSLACTGEPPADEGHTTTTANDDPSDTGLETGSETGEPAAELVVVVTVRQPYPDPDPPQPGVGAVVAVDTSQGRLEATADAEGRAIFDGFEWSGEAIDVTVGHTNASLHSYLGIVETDTEAGVLEVGLQLNGVSDDLVEVFGTAVGKSDDSNFLLIGATGALSYSDVDPEWSLSVASAQPFTLVALELDYLSVPPRTTNNPIFNWFTLEHPGVTEPTELLVDFGAATEPTLVQGAFVMPGRPESPLRLDSFGFVYSIADLGTGPLIGRSTFTEVDPAGETCNYELEHITPPGGEEPITCYRVILPPDYEITSTACEPGHAGAGLVEVELLDSPEVPFVANRGLHDPIDFEIFDTDVQPNLLVYFNSQLVWRVIAPIDATSITVPQPPTGFESEGVILDAQLGLYREAASGAYLERFSYSQVFDVKS